MVHLQKVIAAIASIIARKVVAIVSFIGSKSSLPASVVIANHSKPVIAWRILSSLANPMGLIDWNGCFAIRMDQMGESV